MSKGMAIKYSMVEDNDQYSVNFDYKDTEGFNLRKNYVGTDIENILDNLFNDVVESLILESAQEEEKKSEEEVGDNEYARQLEKIIKDLTAENNSLKTDVKILQRRADDAVNKAVTEDKTVEKANHPQAHRITYRDLMDNPSKLLEFWF